MEEAPFGRFHAYMAWCTAGGPFCDGYILGIITLALPQLSADLHLSTAWTAAIGAISLVGLFVGAAVFGRLTDVIGRRVMYTINLIIFVVASALQLFVATGWQLLALRFLLGIMVGADYPIASALLTEFLPRRRRGEVLASLIAAWWVGYVVSFVVGYLMHVVGGDAWRWTLASSAIPALLILAIRLKAPESPMWLAQRGRREEALAIVHERVGARYTLPEVPPEERQTVRWREIFRSAYGRRTFFVSGFWFCQVAPLFAIYTFQPQLLRGLGVANPYVGSLVVSVFFLVGVFPCTILVGKWGRRPVLLWGFAVTAVVLVLLGLFPHANPAVIITGFAVFAVFNAGASVLQWVYPNELFPTGVRASAVGFAAAMSRVGAAIGTFLLPVGLATIGVGPTLWIAAALCVAGLAISVPLAPETKQLSIAESSGGIGAVPGTERHADIDTSIGDVQ